MCFIIHKKHSTVKIAAEDITCYKIFKFSPLYKGKYLTPFQLQLVAAKSLMISDIEKGALDSSDELTYGIHSLTSLDAAVLFKENYFSKTETVFVECTIPKGSEYYYNPDTNQYISNQLQLGEEIKYVKLQKILNFIVNLFNNLK